MEWAGLTGENVTGKQTSKNSDSGLEHLRLRVDIEGDPLYDIFDCIFKSYAIIEDNKGIEDVYKRQTEVASDIIGGNICAARKI